MMPLLANCGWGHEGVRRSRRMETVLVVDDDAEMCAVAAEMLEQDGYSVLRAEGPSAALNTAEHHPGPIDLLLTDLVMPGMNGVVLAERVRLQRPETKVLFMSGFTRDNLGDQNVLPAGVKLVVKPFTGPELRLKVRELLDQRRSPFARPKPPAGRT
jgi:two-component system, cell cycle sensor histidine kinase and response regulator CckA